MAERILKRGTFGPDVRRVKDLLFKLGFYDKSVTAITHDSFAADTENAVKRYQAARGLEPDGIVGPKTYAALYADGLPAAASAAAGTPTTPTAQSAKGAAMAAELVAYVRSRIGDVYAWGACNLYPITEAWIRNRDTSAAEAERSIKDWRRKQGYSMTDLRAFDCSGLVSACLIQQKIISSKKDCDGLWAMCTQVPSTGLLPGDLCFRVNPTNKEDETHVGVYVGMGRVVHAKGRDVGVVLEGIDQNGLSYWHKFGRMKAYA